MSEPVTTATPAPTPAAETPVSSKPLKPREIAANMAGQLKTRLAAKQAAEDAEYGDEPVDETPAPAAAKPAPKTEKLVERIEAAGGDAPEQKRGESDASYELRLSKTMGELQAAKRQAAKFEKDAQMSGAELAKVKKLLEDGKTNPLTVLEHLGFNFEKLARAIAADEIKAPEKRMELPPDLQAKIDRLDKADKEREANELKARGAAQRETDVKTVTTFLEANAEDFPLAASMGWAASQVVADAYAQGATDVLPVLQELEKGLSTNFAQLMKTDKSLKAMVKKDPALKAAILKALDLDGSPAPKKGVAEDGPESLDEISTDQPARGGKLSREEKIAHMAAQLKARNAKLRAAEEEEDDEF